MRIALRDMTLPEDVLERGILRTSASANGQATPDRGQIGEVVTVVVVTIVFTEIFIEAVAITIGVAVTATVAAEAAEAITRRANWRKKCDKHKTNCLGTDLASQPGELEGHSMCDYCHKECIKAAGKWPSGITDNGIFKSCEYDLPKWQR